MTYGGRTGQGDSFAKRHPVLYGARVAVVCALIMVTAKSVGAWLDDESISLGRMLRYFAIVFSMFFLAATGLFALAKRRGELK